MLSPLSWLRAAVKNAVLAGVGDALQQLDGTDHAEAANALLQRLAAPQSHAEALPRPEASEPHSEAPVAGNGRSRRKPVEAS